MGILWAALLGGPLVAPCQQSATFRADSMLTERLYDRYLAIKNDNKDSAAIYARQILSLGQQRNVPLALGRGYFLLGRVYADQGDYTRGIQYELRALRVYQSIKRKTGVAGVYNEMALMYKQMATISGEQHIQPLLEKGLVYAREALALYSEAKSWNNVASAYNQMGIILRDLHRNDEAEWVFRTAISLLETRKISDPVVLYGNLSELLIARGQYDEAIALLEKAQVFNAAKPRLVYSEYLNLRLSRAYEGKKDYAKAVPYVQQSVQMARRLNESARLLRSLGAAQAIYEAAGDPAKSLAHLKELKALEDSLQRGESVRAVTELQAQYANRQSRDLATIEAQKQQQISAVKTRLLLSQQQALARIEADKAHRISLISSRADVEKARAVAEVKSRYELEKNQARFEQLNKANELKNRQMAWLSGGVALLLLLLLLSYRQSVRIRKNREQIVQQADQMQMLMKELHHRVKNNLAVVSGLLELQASRLPNGAARRVLQEGQQRVQAMALIHQRLYQSDAIATINMREYVEHLASSLMHAYGHMAGKFDLTIEVGVSTLDTDTAIPVGLILNELLTNAFKHAYEHVARPSLRIQLNQPVGTNGAGGLLLDVQDNGPGLDLATWHQPEGSFGKRLIQGLAEQIGAKVTVNNRDGLSFRLYVPASPLASA
ncbi:histidine kinase dimerization/phosphoacceptor domain -containing protein [Fibrella aquatilis]|uniref:histidine kinase n=1 Tax=Fibrella aquatilis TaxID=2817059 RepID=A0A939K2K9_9BACT|nr:histidine kinase dimerization/phosphoacceptor domain -containing protein [Fibrella aquatilis]MBO0933415.1 hypothetical protein [Fibrella aquatilis]